jgi:hypothetical protein
LSIEFFFINFGWHFHVFKFFHQTTPALSEYFKFLMVNPTRFVLKHTSVSVDYNTGNHFGKKKKHGDDTITGERVAKPNIICKRNRKSAEDDKF